MVKVRRWKPGVADQVVRDQSTQDRMAEREALRSRIGERIISEQRALMQEYRDRGASTKPVTRTFRSI